MQRRGGGSDGGQENYFALQSHHGAFLCAENGGGLEIKANRQHVAEWEAFRFYETERVSDEVRKGHFRAFDGKYLTVRHSHEHWVANAENVTDALEFEVRGVAQGISMDF
jgi:hypothetical protein